MREMGQHLAGLSEVSDGFLFPLQRELTALQSVVATQEEELQVQASDIESLTRTIQMKEDLIKVRRCARLGEFTWEGYRGVFTSSHTSPEQCGWLGMLLLLVCPQLSVFLWPEGKGPKPPDCCCLVFCSFCAKHPPSSPLLREHPS